MMAAWRATGEAIVDLLADDVMKVTALRGYGPLVLSEAEAAGSSVEARAMCLRSIQRGFDRLLPHAN